MERIDERIMSNCPVLTGGQRAIDRHFIEEQRHQQGDGNGVRCGKVALQLELNQRKEEKQYR